MAYYTVLVEAPNVSVVMHNQCLLWLISFLFWVWYGDMVESVLGSAHSTDSNSAHSHRMITTPPQFQECISPSRLSQNQRCVSIQQAQVNIWGRCDFFTFYTFENIQNSLFYLIWIL